MDVKRLEVLDPERFRDTVHIGLGRRHEDQGIVECLLVNIVNSCKQGQMFVDALCRGLGGLGTDNHDRYNVVGHNRASDSSLDWSAVNQSRTCVCLYQNL